MYRWLITLGALGFIATMAFAQKVNTDESQVVRYTLPELLASSAGTVATADAWNGQRRPELLGLFSKYIYGVTPIPGTRPAFSIEADEHGLLGGLAERKIVRIIFAPPADQISLRMYLFLPEKRGAPAPVFIGVHLFDTNAPYPKVAVPLASHGDKIPAEIMSGLPGEQTAAEILKRGFGFSTLNVNDFAPDNKEHFAEGLIGAYRAGGPTEPPAKDEWGTLGAWAFGLSRALDYFETDKNVDAKRVIAIGHSRMGKTALWAAAQDARFAMAISNCSGCMGAALTQRNFGETATIMAKNFPHWFCPTFQTFANNEQTMPVDQHMLIALIAPRPVYIASAEEDSWSDPKGEFLAGKAAEPAYALFGKKGLGVDELPPLNHPVGESIGYHLRSGKHDITDYDWVQYLAFAARVLK